MKFGSLVLRSMVVIGLFSIFSMSSILGSPVYEDLFRDLESADLVLLPEGASHKDYAFQSNEIQSNGLMDFIDVVQKREERKKKSWSFKKLKRKYSWYPKAKTKYTAQAECTPSELEDLLKSANGINHQAVIIREFYKRCDNDMFGVGSGEYYSMLKNGLIEYELHKHPGIRGLFLKLDDGSVVRAFLGLKPGQEKRPLIVVKCGIMCNLNNSEELRIMTMHFYDESPFNILLVGNISGTEYQGDNGHFAIGGAFEGQQLIHVAKKLRETKVAKYISEIHLMGVSLGGHAALYTSLFNDYNLKPDGSKHYKSVMAICPVVNLQKSIYSLYYSANPIKRKAIGFATQKHLVKLIQLVPYFGEYITLDGSGKQKKYVDIIVDGSIKYFKEKSDETPDWMLPPLKSVNLKGSEDFWNLNNFVNYADLVSTPTLVLAAKNDIMVLTKQNAATLDTERLSPAIQLIQTKRGSHCAFSVNYGWRYMSAIYRGYIKGQLTAQSKASMLPAKKAITIPFNKRIRMDEGEQHLYQWWEARKGKRELRLYFKIFSPDDFYESAGSCHFGHKRLLPTYCYRKVFVRVPFSRLPGLGLTPPKNETEAESLTRRLNLKLSLLDEKGKTLQEQGSIRYIKSSGPLFP